MDCPTIVRTISAPLLHLNCTITLSAPSPLVHCTLTLSAPLSQTVHFQPFKPSTLDRTRFRNIYFQRQDRIFSAYRWVNDDSQVILLYIFSERTVCFLLSDDSFMILRDRIFYAKRSYIFSEKTVFFQYFRAVYFRRPFILHRGHYIFSSKIVYFTVDPLISLKYSLSQIFSLIEPKKWLRIFEKIFRFLANFRFFGQKFFFSKFGFLILSGPLLHPQSLFS